MDDYYSILDVETDATSEMIKKSYHILARKFHPDKNSDPQAEQKFRQITKAYDVLGNPEKRNRYDSMTNQSHVGDFLASAIQNKEDGDDALDDFYGCVTDILNDTGLEDLLRFDFDEDALENKEPKTRQQIMDELKREAINDPELREYLQSVQIFPQDIQL